MQACWSWWKYIPAVVRVRDDLMKIVWNHMCNRRHTLQVHLEKKKKKEKEREEMVWQLADAQNCQRHNREMHILDLGLSFIGKEGCCNSSINIFLMFSLKCLHYLQQ